MPCTNVSIRITRLGVSFLRAARMPRHYVVVGVFGGDNAQKKKRLRRPPGAAASGSTRPTERQTRQNPAGPEPGAETSPTRPANGTQNDETHGREPPNGARQRASNERTRPARRGERRTNHSSTSGFFGPSLKQGQKNRNSGGERNTGAEIKPSDEQPKPGQGSQQTA